MFYWGKGDQGMCFSGDQVMCSSGVKETRACVLVETMEGICLGGARETRVCVLVRPGLCD